MCTEHTIIIWHDPDYAGEARMTAEDGQRVLIFGAKDPKPSASAIVALLRTMADAQQAHETD